jgi:hypothetical protein
VRLCRIADPGDFNVWQTDFGNDAGSAAGDHAGVTVPKPQASLLLGLGGFLLASAGKR